MFEILSTCKGGGYSYCRTSPPHPKRNAKGLYPLHRVKMENKIGRLLGSDEVVHHKDGDKTNDSLNNLEVMSRSDHTVEHAKDRRVEEEVYVCAFCDKRFKLLPRSYRLQQKRNASGLVSCSRSCGSKSAWKIRCGEDKVDKSPVS